MADQLTHEQTLEWMQSLNADAKAYTEGLVDLKRCLERQEDFEQGMAKTLEKNTQVLLEMLSTLNARSAQLTKEMHATAQREKTRSTVFLMQAKGFNSDEIIKALLSNPPVVESP